MPHMPTAKLNALRNAKAQCIIVCVKDETAKVLMARMSGIDVAYCIFGAFRLGVQITRLNA